MILRKRIKKLQKINLNGSVKNLGIALILLLLTTPFSSKSADYDTSVFNPILREMRHYSDTLRNSFNQEKRFLYNDTFKTVLRTFVETEGSFDVDADSLNTVMFKRSPDGKVRAITWLVADNEGNYQSLGVVQYRKKKDVINIWLNEKTNQEKKDLATSDLSQNEWTGGLIYQIIEFKYKRKVRYLIMTFHGLDTKLNQKTLDVMSFEDENIVFGLPVFLRYEKDLDPDYRVIFTFSDQATMVLRYDKKEELIVFDKLVPAASFVAGDDEFLIPDGTYSAYKPLRGGKWQKLEDFGEYTDLEKRGRFRRGGF